MLRGLLWLVLIAGYSVPPSCSGQGAAPPRVITGSPPASVRGNDLRARLEAAPKLQVEQKDVAIQLPPGEILGMVSWVAYDRRSGLTWILQRGKEAPPVLAVDNTGVVVHAFGNGLFSIPHAIRVAPDGTLWTVDAGSSKIMQFSPDGKVLLQFEVSRKPATTQTPFAGATDIAFAKGHVFISDGYTRARVLEYTRQGRKVREWGSAGSAPGQFHLPHCIVADGATLYVADRENGRVEAFDLHGRFLREFDHLGRVYAVQVDTQGHLWATTAPMDQPPGSAGWIVELDSQTGRVLGSTPVTETPALHTLDLNAEGEPITDVGNRVIRFEPPKADRTPH